jgi:tripartite-type tricarboxylate transporter receptor subunit TctC
MKRAMSLILAVTVIAALLASGCGGGVPQATPTKAIKFPEAGKTITMIVPYTAGGGGDIGARLLAPIMAKELGGNIEVVNRVGAGSQVGVTELAQAKPDGYTIGFTHLPAVITIYLDPERQSVFTKKSLQTIGMYVIDPDALAVKADSPYKTMKDLVDAAKAAPGKISIGDSGILSDGHIAIMQLQQLSGARFAIVHGAGGAQGTADLLGGQVTAQNMNLGGSNLELVRSGQVRFLGIFDKQTSANYPGVPTAESQGFPIFSATSRAISAPAGTPSEIVALLTGAMKRAMEGAELKQKAKDLGLVLAYMSPTELDKYWTDMETSVKPLMDLAKK